MKDNVNPKEVTIALHPGYEETNIPKIDKITEEFKEMAEKTGVDD